MKNTFHGWAAVDAMDINSVANLILTGYDATTAMPDGWLYGVLEKDTQGPITLLDFGCGMGRNSFGLANRFPNWTIVGYDNDAMLAKTADYAAIHYAGKIPSNLKFTSEWEQVRTQKFDKIICTLVLQHIMERDLIRYVHDFKHMTKFLLVMGRRFNDDVGKRSTWTILEECELVPTSFYHGHRLIPYTPTGDRSDHNMGIYILSQ